MPKVEQVGYRNPPAHSRFRKGQSGNPKGRPVGLTKSMAGALTQALAELDAGGGETRLEAVMRVLIDRALAGDARLMSLLVSELHKIEARNETETEADSVSAADREVVAALLLRIGRAR